MGFFAVLNEPGTPPFEVIHCHLNLWSLQGLFTHRIFLWDVGLRLRANEAHDLAQFRLALPFGTQPGGFEDLGQKLLNQKVAALIFGEPVSITESTITYEDLDPVRVIPISEVDATREKEHSDQSFSIWRFNLSEPINMGREGYLRVRFEVRGLGRSWTWKRSLLAKQGAIVDIRISDTREAWDVKGGGIYFQPRILPIQKLYLFIIAPTWLQGRTMSPPIRHLRLLEGRAWEPYVGSATDITRSGKLLVYYWRNDSETKTTKPFRAFLDLSREFGPTSWRNHLRTVLLLIPVLIALHFLSPQLNSARMWVKDLALDFWNWIWGLGLLGLLALGKYMFGRIKFLVEVWRFLNRFILSVERSLLNFRGSIKWYK